MCMWSGIGGSHAHKGELSAASKSASEQREQVEEVG